MERVSLVKSCLPAKAVVKTSPEFRPELTDWLLIRGPIGQLWLSIPKKGVNTYARLKSRFTLFPQSTWMQF